MFASRPSRRIRQWIVGASAVILVTLAAPAGAARADDIPVPPSDTLTKNGKGVVTAADRDFVTKVRLAGLWEIPAGNMAQQKSKDPRVRAVGKEIARQHVELDRIDREVAAQLGIPLPNQPSDQQQFWLSEMRNAKTSQEFDEIFVDRLRRAHGGIFPAIATIRASTRNDSVRRLAQQTNQFVATHLTLLESSGLVDYGSMPTAPPPAAAGNGPVPVDGGMIAAASSSASSAGVNTSVVLIVLAGALVAGVITTMRIFRSR